MVGSWPGLPVVGGPAVEGDEVLHRRDDILEAERPPGVGGQGEVLVAAVVRPHHDVPARRQLPQQTVELGRHLMAADLAQVVLAQVLEEEVVEIGLGLPGDDELLAAEFLVDVLLGLLDALDLVLAQGLDDGRVFLLGIAGQDLDVRSSCRASGALWPRA